MSNFKSMRPMSGTGRPLSAHMKVAPVQQEVSTTIEKEENINLNNILQRIRDVNDTANSCVEVLKQFNQQVSEQISSTAKQQILTLGEKIIDPRVKEQYKLVGRLQQSVQHPEQTQTNLYKIQERIENIEKKVDMEKFQKLQNDVQKIKNVLLKIVKLKKSDK